MAARRSLSFRPLTLSNFVVRPKSQSSNSSSVSANATTKKNKRQKQLSKPLTIKNLPFDEYLKKRTRSVTAFDYEIYKKYSSIYGADHVPVMLGEVLDVFRHSDLRSFVDCTLGAAGHSSAIIEKHGEMEVYVGLDIDPVAHEKGKERIEEVLKDKEGLKAFTHLRNFKYIKSVLGGIDENLLSCGVDGILMDLGMSSMQVNYSKRGFSVLDDGPLDMRMDPQASLTAKDILNSWPEEEVGRILRDYGEESNWRSLQRKIVEARTRSGLHSTNELVELVKTTAVGSMGRQGWLKTATRVFQALRIAVNDELQTLEDALYSCFDSLSSNGRLVVISFHSLEDRIVKKTFLDLIERGGENETYAQPLSINAHEATIDTGIWSKQSVEGRNGTILTKKPITPTKEEEELNRRCRSAKLRVVQKA